MRLRELMTPDLITVGPESTLKEAARRMIEAGVSGLPVTDDDGRLVGVITESDFVKEEAGRRAEKRARLLRLFTRDNGFSAQRNVGDVMTREVISLGPDADHADAARVMGKSRIKRIPVIDDEGSLVGMVSRSDILRAFARSDREILDELINRVMRDVLWIDPARVDVSCRDGNVILRGKLETRSDAELLVEFTRRVDGVVSVTDALSFEVDNTKVQMMPNPPGFVNTRSW